MVGPYTLTVITDPKVQKVELLDATDHILQTLVSDADGVTDIPGLEPAMYKVRGSKNGYITNTVTVHVFGHTNVSLTLLTETEPQHGGEIVAASLWPERIAAGGSTTITATGKNTGDVTEYFILNIWSETHNSHWSEYLLLGPADTINHSRTVTNITKSETFWIVLWRWTGTDWVRCHDVTRAVFVEEPEPEPDACPNFWTDPVGAVMCWIINGLETLLGWTAGTLTTKLGEMWDLVTNFGGKIVDFFSDAVGTIIDWVRDNAGEIFDWLGDNFANFTDWLGEVGGDIAGFVTDSIGGALDFLTENVGAFFDWLGEIGGTIADYIGGAIGDFVDWSSDQLGSIWDGLQTYVGGFFDWLAEVGGSVADYVGGAIGDFVDWSSDQLGSIWEGIQTWFGEAISGLVEAFFGGVKTGTEQAKHSPLHTDEPVRNPVLRGLIKSVRKHRKKYGRNEITGEKENGTT